MNDLGPDVHLWIIWLDEVDTRTEDMVRLLDSSELARYHRFATDRLKQRFAITHGYLRRLLSMYLRVHPNQIRYRLSTCGKPAVAFPSTSLHFNLSHSGDLAVVAIARCKVGVDVEEMRRGPETMGIARSFFSPQETSELLRLPDRERDQAFFRIWTSKEAYVKCIGHGLALALNSFSVPLGDDPQTLTLSWNAAGESDWQLHEYWPRPGYVGALIYAGARRKLEVNCWSTSANHDEV